MTEEHYWINLAQAAYDAYAFKQPQWPGLWSDLSESQRDGWVAAVKEATDIYVAAALA